MKRKTFDFKISELNAKNQGSKKVADNYKFGDIEVDGEFAWFLNFINESNEQAKSLMKEVIGDEEVEDEAEAEAEADKDRQYSVFFKELTDNDKFYKLQVSGKDEAPPFVEYHKQDISEEYNPPTHTNIVTGKSQDKNRSYENMRSILAEERIILMTKGSLRQKKTPEHKSVIDPHEDIAVDASFLNFLDGCINLEYYAFKYEGKRVNYEHRVASSDSDVLVLDGSCCLSEVNNKQKITAEKNPSLKRELLCILSQPYNQKEYEELLEYVEQQKPICRSLHLRNRVISSALGGLTKSVLDDVPTSFRKRFDAVRNERPKVLNLLRGFRFWLEHLPNEGVFKPWLDEDCKKVLPLSRTT